MTAPAEQLTPEPAAANDNDHNPIAIIVSRRLVDDPNDEPRFIAQILAMLERRRK